MGKLNYKGLSLKKFQDFTELTADYNLGEVLYSILRKVEKPVNVSTHWLTSITDEQFYQAIERAEKEELIEQQEVKLC